MLSIKVVKYMGMSKTEAIILVLVLANLALTVLVYKKSEEAQINSHNAYQRSVLINQDLINAGVIK